MSTAALQVTSLAVQGLLHAKICLTLQDAYAGDGGQQVWWDKNWGKNPKIISFSHI